MQYLTEIAITKAPQGVFTRTELSCWIDGSLDRRNALLKRALAAREIVRIHRGLYLLAEKYLRQQIDPLCMAQRLDGPSYISLESALSEHGWIPEAVHTVTSVTAGRAKEYTTPIGHFSFVRVPQRKLYTQVRRLEGQGGVKMLGSPLKALCDYVHTHKCDWHSAAPVIESLRVDERSFSQLRQPEFDELLASYRSARVRRFLLGLRKELKQ